MIKITECPRDAMQGIVEWIPTDLKVDYINKLLECNFDVLDFGSFVSPKAIPQMKDTAEVLSKLNLENINTELLAIVANKRGAEDAVKHEQITYLGFPFSVSETFQQRNTNSSIADSFESVLRIQELAVKNNKKLLVYISMGFGNPYGDTWHPEIVTEWTSKLAKEDIKHFALSDTIGCSNKESIEQLFNLIVPSLPEVNIGAHLHSTPDTIIEKLKAAINANCSSFDVAIKGMGGCPMAKDDLTGNMDSIPVLQYLEENTIQHQVNMAKFSDAVSFSGKIFDNHH